MSTSHSLTGVSSTNCVRAGGQRRQPAHAGTDGGWERRLVQKGARQAVCAAAEPALALTPRSSCKQTEHTLKDTHRAAAQDPYNGTAPPQVLSLGPAPPSPAKPRTAVAAAAGTFHALAITSEGTVVAWAVDDNADARGVVGLRTLRSWAAATAACASAYRLRAPLCPQVQAFAPVQQGAAGLRQPREWRPPAPAAASAARTARAAR
jgi:hypothetical protein